MIIFLYGPETFLSRQNLQEIIARYREKHRSGLNLATFDFSENIEEKIAAFKDFLGAVSMFAEKKLAVIKNAVTLDESRQEELKKFLVAKNLKKDTATFLLFWEDKEVNKKNILFKFLQDKEIKVQNFAKLTGTQLANWARRRIKQDGGEISAGALNQLLLLTGDDLWLLANEIDKLLALSFTIDEAAVEQLVTGRLRLNIFATIEAIAQGQKEKAWCLIWQHLTQGEDPGYLISMIIFQFRNLVLVSQLLREGVLPGQLAAKAKLHPFVVKKTQAQLKFFTFTKLKNIYQLLVDLELKNKKGVLSPQTGLDLLIAAVG